MPTDVTLPELGENIDHATVLDVLVSKGDTVEKDQALLNLESDKAEFDLPSPSAGTIAEVLVKRGDEVSVGQVILRLEDGGRARAETGETKAQTQRPADATPRDRGDGATAAASPAARDGEPAERGADEGAGEVRTPPRSSGAAGTSKPAPEERSRPAPRDRGVDVRTRSQPDDGGLDQRVPNHEESSRAPHVDDAADDDAADDDADADTQVANERAAQRPTARKEQTRKAPTDEREHARVADARGAGDASADASAEPMPKSGKGGEAEDAEAQRGAGQAPRTPVAAAPSVRRLARELGIDVSEVTGTGPDGRMSAEDVYRHVRRKLASLETSTRPAEKDRDYSRWGEARVEPMSTVRRRTAEQMSLAWSTIPHVTHHDLADITELDRLRRQFAPRVEKAGGKLTVTAVLLKVVGSALRRYPKFNASVDMENAAIIYKGFINVGVAVDTERGLLVPVIRRVDEKNIVELALELKEASEAARARKIRPEMLQGATFTVTNLGGIGGTHFNPLINPPEVAVLGVARADTQSAWVDGRFEPRLMLPLSVSYDHRIIDGADAARFLRWVCEAMAEPFLMDLEGD